VANLEWAHLIIGIMGAIGGAAAGIFSGGWRLGKIEGRLALHIQESISASEKRYEEKMGQATGDFGETLKGLRQKINDVELDTERRFVAKDDFNDFREEYREDMRDLKKSIADMSHN